MEDDQLFIVVPSSKLELAHELSDMPYPLMGYMGVAFKLLYGEEIESYDPILLDEVSEIYGNDHKGMYLEDINKRNNKNALFISALLDFITDWDYKNDPGKYLCDIRICKDKVVMLFTDKEEVDYEPQIGFESGSQEVR